MRGLHAANVLQTSDVVRSAEMGLIVWRRRRRPAGRAGGGALPDRRATTAVGAAPPRWPSPAALFGTWTSTMIGVSTPSKRLRASRPQIEHGQILLMVRRGRCAVRAVEEAPAALHPRRTSRAPSRISRFP
jgi:hypothetical protein